jgi:SAM-dependent methyltransferase
LEIVNNPDFYFQIPCETENISIELNKIINQDTLIIENWYSVITFSNKYSYSAKSAKQYWDLSHSGKPDTEFYPLYHKVIDLYENKVDKITNANILDLCCGKGMETANFANKSNSVLGVDISYVAIETALMMHHDKANLYFKCDDIVDFLFSCKDNFDIIFSKLGLHYFDKATTTKLFQQIKFVLKKNGLLYFMVRATDDPSYGKGQQLSPNYFKNQKDFRHRRYFFNQKDLEEVLKKTGFGDITIKKLKIDYFGYMGSVYVVSCFNI